MVHDEALAHRILEVSGLGQEASDGYGHHVARSCPELLGLGFGDVGDRGLQNVAEC